MPKLFQRAFYKISEDIAKKPRKVAKRALKHMPEWKQGRKWIYSQEGKSLSGSPITRHGYTQRPKFVPKEPSQDHILVRGENYYRGTPIYKPKKKAVAASMKRYSKDTEKSYLRTPDTKKKIKLSEKQWRRLMERNIGRETAQRNIVSGIEAPQERLFTRLYEQRDIGGEMLKTPRDYPYAEGMLRYMKSRRGEGPELKPSPQKVPDATVLSYQGEKPVFEKRRFRSVQPERFDRAITGARAVEEEQAREAAKAAEQQRRSVDSLKERLGYHQTKQVAEAPAEELVKQGLIAEQMWRFIGGRRTLSGKMWDRLKDQSRGRQKPSTMDYFIRTAIRWMNDPESVAKNQPREARLLEGIWDEFRSQ